MDFGCNKRRLLTVATSACSCAAFGFLCISVSTEFWLYTKERIDTNKTIGPIYRHVYSGLWRKCSRIEIREKNWRCSYIQYFTDEEKEGLDPTEAILLNIRQATMFPLVSLFILLIGGIFCFIGHYNNHKKILTFVSGILFVLSGLCILVGIILYIGSITGEVGNKPRASIEKPKFEYEYGSSFYMSVGSFVLTELSGVFSVYLYIYKHKHSQKLKQRQALNKSGNHNDHNHGGGLVGGGGGGAGGGEAAGGGGNTGNYGNSNRHNVRRSVPRENSCDRSQSWDRSRDPSTSRSESYFTYTPISDSASHELSNYGGFTRENTNNTISTTAELHVPSHATNKENCTSSSTTSFTTPNANANAMGSATSQHVAHAPQSCSNTLRSSPPPPPNMPSIDIVRRTTPV